MKHIEWTDYSYNFTRGCSRVSEGCRHCYAERIAARFSGEDQATADERIPLLLETPAAVRFVSAEPLLGLVDLEGKLPVWRCCEYGEAHDFRDAAWRWGFGGSPEHSHGQAGHVEARRFDGLDWVIVGAESGPGARPMSLEWARGIVAQCQIAKVSVFVKQLCAKGKVIPFEEWPEGLQVREFPAVTP